MYRNAKCELFDESVICGFRTTSAELVHTIIYNIYVNTQQFLFFLF